MQNSDAMRGENAEPCQANAQITLNFHRPRKAGHVHLLHPSFRDDSKSRTSGAQLRTGESRDFDASHRPGMTGANRGSPVEYASRAMTAGYLFG